MEFDQISEEEGLKIHNDFKKYKDIITKSENNYHQQQPNQVELVKEYIINIKSFFIKLYNKEINKEEFNQQIKENFTKFNKNYENTLVGYPYVKAYQDDELTSNLESLSFTTSIGFEPRFSFRITDKNGIVWVISPDLFEYIENMKIIECILFRMSEKELLIHSNYLKIMKELINEAYNQQLSQKEFFDKCKLVSQDFLNKLTPLINNNENIKKIDENIKKRKCIIL